MRNSGSLKYVDVVVFSVNVVCQHCHIPHHAMHSYSQHSSRTRQVNWPFVNGQVPRARQWLHQSVDGGKEVDKT